MEVVNNLMSISAYDDYTFNHSLNVMALAVAVGNSMNLNKMQLKKLAMGSMFHDIGKLFVPKEILNKKGRLTQEEFAIIMDHPQKGYEFLRDFTDLPSAIRILALEHHEKWDGSGYPNNRNGEEIHISGRICAVCDVFEALIADRPYRSALTVNDAREYILGSGGSQFDINIVQLFSNIINPYPLDTMVRLSNGCEGVVVKVINSFFTRPNIRIYSEDGNKVAPYDIFLMKNPNIVISETIYGFAFEQA